MNESAETPRQIGAFIIERELWHGARSTVYLARDGRDDARVALKLLYPRNEADLQAQRRDVDTEAARLRMLSHPYIISLRKHGEIDGIPYLSFPFVEGQNLAEALKTGELGSERMLALLIGICEAIQHAHSRGIFHRDLKPHNILIDTRGLPCVLDWGLSWRAGGKAERGVTQIVGTPAYMSPEQARGQEEGLTSASDVYSLGAILYHMLAGRPPFEGATSWKTMQMAMSLPPHPPSAFQATIDLRLERVALWALEKDPAKRYPDAKALADDLQRVRNNGSPRGPGGLLGRLFKR